MTAFRIWVEGEAPAAAFAGEGERCTAAATEVATEEVPVLLAGRVGLGPRPALDHPPVRLAPGPMSMLLGHRVASGHGLPDDLARAVQAVLDGGIRHWAVRLEIGGGQVRRNVEVADGERGMWRVRARDALVELAPTTPTDVLRAFVELAARARDAA